MVTLSGNPSSDSPTQIAHQLDDLAKSFDKEMFGDEWEKLFPDTCHCCIQSLFEDAAAMLRDYALTEAGKELEESR